MESSSDPLNHPPGSSPPPTISSDLGELPIRSLSPSLPSLPAEPMGTTFINPQSIDISYSLQETTPIPSNTATPHRLSRNLIRKRGPSSPTHGPSFSEAHINKEARTIDLDQSNSARDLVLQARDLLVKAYTVTSSRTEQSKLLDLLEVFREYTEKGRLQTASKIGRAHV